MTNIDGSLLPGHSGHIRRAQTTDDIGHAKMGDEDFQGAPLQKDGILELEGSLIDYGVRWFRLDAETLSREEYSVLRRRRQLNIRCYLQTVVALTETPPTDCTLRLCRMPPLSK